MEDCFGFTRFVALDERDAPQLLQRMTAVELRVNGERYGVESRLIARPGTTVADLGVAIARKLLHNSGVGRQRIVALVLSSRMVGVEEAAAEIAERLHLTGLAVGVERACSGFPAATELGLKLGRELRGTVAIVAAEIISQSINWETPAGDLGDHRRARGQASKLFGDGAAAVLIEPAQRGRTHEILDAWAGEVADDQLLLQKAEILDSIDPWGHRRPGATGCISMPGRRGLWLVRRAPELMAEALDESLKRAFTGLDGQTIHHVVPHQANGLILERLQSRLRDAPGTPQVWNCIRNSGNTVSASIPLAMAEVQDQLPAQVLVGMPSVGAGGPGYRPDVLSVGCVLVRTRGTAP